MIGNVIQNIATVIAIAILLIVTSIKYLVSFVASLLLLVLLSPLIIYAYFFNKDILQAHAAPDLAVPAAPKLSVEEIERKFPSRAYKDISIEEVTFLFSGLPPPPRSNASQSAVAATAAVTSPATGQPPAALFGGAAEGMPRHVSLVPNTGQPVAEHVSSSLSKQKQVSSASLTSSGPTSQQTSVAASIASLPENASPEPEYPVLALTRTLTADTFTCPICLCRPDPDAMVRLLPCGHMFHTSCVDEWFTLQALICPVCRRQYCSRPTPFPTIRANRRAHAHLVSRPP